MKKLLLAMLFLLLVGCTAKTNTSNTDFSKRMINEEAKVSIILGVNYEEMGLPISETEKITLSPNFINLDGEYEFGLESEICTNDQLDMDTEVYFDKLSTLIDEYSSLIAGIKNSPSDAKVNYNDLIVGFECVDDLHSTAYLYTNKVMKIIVGDTTEFYTLSDKEYNDIVTAYIDFSNSYLNDVDSSPCWVTLNAEDSE